MALDQLMLRKYNGIGSPHTVFVLEGVSHVALMAVPGGGVSLQEQAEQSLGAIRTALAKNCPASSVVAQTVFLKDANDQRACQKFLDAHYGAEAPVTTYVLQPPCNGAALAVEAWAIDRNAARIDRQSPHLVSVTYNHVTWVHCGGIIPDAPDGGVYKRSGNAFAKMRGLIEKGAGFDHTVRTWLYLGDIVGPEGETQRYKELNRARTDFYLNVPFGRAHRMKGLRHGMYPASTGIGMGGSDVAMSGLAMDTTRGDVFLLPLENPQQTPAYQYHARHSPHSPKFCRAMAVVLGGAVVTFVSGTASIVDSETKHVGDVTKQTEQTIENIERLIAADNFAAHHLPGAGATLRDIVAVRVYVKRPEDYPKCRAVCQKRFAEAPVIYVVADICRPELLVEIEAVAFSQRTV